MKILIQRLLNFFYPVVKKILPFQVYAYLAVGAANTFLNIGLFILLFKLIEAFSLAVEVATAVSFAITVVTGFWLQKNFAFAEAENTKTAIKKQFGKYAMVALQGQFSAYLLTKSMIILLKMNASAAYIITTIIMLIVNYFLQKYFTFKQQQKKIKPEI